MRALARSPLLRIVALAFVVVSILGRWDAATGFTSLIRFGDRFADRRLPVLHAFAIAPSPGDGYDGQFYAQIAVDVNVTSPQIIKALDKPSYRARRILLPLLAHGLGAGSPWIVLQVYAMLNLVMWVTFAIVLWRLLPTTDWRMTASWGAAVFSVGALDSVRMSLTDLPALLFLVLATYAVERRRPIWAALCCLTAGFIREVALLGALAVRANPDDDRARLHTFWLRAACTVPVLVWCAWLALHLPGPVGHEGNFDWPGLAMAEVLSRDVRAISARGWLAQEGFGIIGGLGLVCQSVYVLRLWPSIVSDPWVRMGLPFALLFWVIGVDPWIDYRAIARDCLPMTVAFNVLLARRTNAHPAWYLTNLALVVDGMARMVQP